MNVVFFGSTQESVIVLEKMSLCHFVTLSLCCIVSQPPRPVGRKQVLTPTPVALWAKQHAVPSLSFPTNPQKPWLFADEQHVVDALQPLKADILISACYGQKIPWGAIQAARFGGLNVHPSILPRWRGADPVPWAILSGDRQTGVTIMTLSKEFDEGRIIAQKKIPITDTDMSDPLRTKLFTIGADLLMEVLPGYVAKPIHSPLSILHSSSYARRLTRDDGFEPWEAIQKAFEDPQQAKRIDRTFRAFHPWPGLWTKIGDKRLKILSLHLQPTTHNLQLDSVQLEGKKPVSWKQFQEAHLTS